MTTNNKIILDRISIHSNKRKLKLQKKSESGVQNKPLHSNSFTQLDFPRLGCISDSSLMSLTNSFHQISLQSKHGTVISQRSSNSYLSKEPSNIMGYAKLLKKRERSVDKKRLKNFSQSFLPYDPEAYNADGSLHTIYCLPSMEELWDQAKLARYLRTPRRKEEEKDLLSKQLYPIFKYHQMKETKHKNKL